MNKKRFNCFLAGFCTVKKERYREEMKKTEKKKNKAN